MGPLPIYYQPLHQFIHSNFYEFENSGLSSHRFKMAVSPAMDFIVTGTYDSNVFILDLNGSPDCSGMAINAINTDLINEESNASVYGDYPVTFNNADGPTSFASHISVANANYGSRAFGICFHPRKNLFGVGFRYHVSYMTYKRDVSEG